MIYIGDGIIPQVERFASKYFYNKLTVNAFVSALNMLREKAEKPTGNVWTVKNGWIIYKYIIKLFLDSVNNLIKYRVYLIYVTTR